MEFEQRLQRAIQRGQQTRVARDQEQASRKMSSEEQRSVHSRARIDLSDRIETCLRKLADNFPGFRYESILGEQGWGSRIARDDLQLQRGGPSSSLYSRLELLVTPLGSIPIVEMVGKGTIRNREVIQRRHFQQLDQLDLESFAELIDLWVLEYAEQYAASK
jgi:hypothetical protein